MIPGSNLLNKALSLITSQSVTYYKASGRTLNAVKQYVTTYDAPVTLRGSFQPVSKQVMQTMGLDLQKSYYVFYSSTDLKSLERDFSPDLLVFNGKVLTVESDADWYVIDGWKGSLCVVSDLPIPEVTP